MEARTSPRMASEAAAVFRGLGWWLALTAAFFALGVAVLFAARRVGDGTHQALEGAELLLLTVVLVGSVLAFRRVRRPADELAASDLALHLAPTLAAILLATAVSSAESPLGAVILLWIALAVEETWFWNNAAGRLRQWLAPAVPGTENAERAGPRRQGAAPPAGAPSVPAVETAPMEESAADAFSPGHLQQVTRLRDANGAEVIHGLLRAEFAANQRVHHLHVAFCPPLSTKPEFAMEQIEGPEATLTAGQVESYGARIDLRLAAAAQEGESVVVEFYARGAG